MTIKPQTLSVLVFVFLTQVAGAQDLTTDAQILARGLEIELCAAEHLLEDRWGQLYFPSVGHPEHNDSGLPTRYPESVPPLDSDEGYYLAVHLRPVKVSREWNPWFLAGKQEIAVVELRATVVAKNLESKLEIFSPRSLTEYLVLALDARDGQWKLVESFPSWRGIVTIPSFLRWTSSHQRVFDSQKYAAELHWLWEYQQTYHSEGKP